MLVLQGSLLDSEDAVGPGALLGSSTHRTDLGDGAWIDVRRGWIAGADTLFDRLHRLVPWQAERRRMYDRTVEVPRLTRFYSHGESLPDPAVDKLKEALDDYYAPDLGEGFASVGMCLYRHGHDSVAWHGDTIGRGATYDTVVAIASLGASRRLLLRPRGGGTARRYTLARGDLLVMGGSCQRTWEHAIPKTATPVGPRISLQFRPRDVG